MKLSTCQFNQIQSHLSKGNIYYTDIKEELVDHFASKVEDAMDKGISFDEAFSEVSKEIKPSSFQRRILLASHLGFLKAIFNNMLRISILMKSLLFFAVYFIFSYFFNYSPTESVEHLKITLLSTTVGFAVLGLWNDLIKNSQILSAFNTLWILLCISHFILNFDLLVGLSVSPLLSSLLITFILSLLYISGLSEVVNQSKKLHTA